MNGPDTKTKPANFVTHHPCEVAIISGFFHHWAELFQLVLYF
jgi:hypothetical protein